MVESIWHDIDNKLKKKELIKKEEWDFIKNYIENAKKILDNFQIWIDRKRMLIKRHENKLKKAKKEYDIYKLAKII